VSCGGDGSDALVLPPPCDAIVSAGGLRLIGLFKSSAMGDGIRGVVTDRCMVAGSVDGRAAEEGLLLPPLPLPTDGTLASVLEGGETDFLGGLETAMAAGCGVATEILGGDGTLWTLVRVAKVGVDVDRDDTEATFFTEDSDTGEGVRCGMRFAFD
jgi:hypothetical protein